MPSMIDTILDYIPEIYQFPILILLLILPYLVPILNDIRVKKGKRLKWINFLKCDQKVADCASEFKKETAPSFKWNLTGSVLGYILITILFIYTITVNSIIGTTESLYHYMASVNLLMILVILFLWYNVAKPIPDIKTHEDIKRTNKYFTVAAGLTSVATFAIILSIFFTTFAYKYIKTPELIAIGMLYFLISFFLTVVVRWSARIYKDWTNKLKHILLDEYSEAFPHVCIKDDAREFKGKVQDIFDNDLIVFGNNELKTAVEWDEITSMEISIREDNETETKSTQNETSESTKEENKSQFGWRTNMKNKYKAGAFYVIGALYVIFVVLLVKVVLHWVNTGDWSPIDVILTSMVVVITAIYTLLTHMIVKQGADRDRIAFIERKLEKCYFPMRSFFTFLNTDMYIDESGTNQEKKIGPLGDAAKCKISQDNQIQICSMLDEIIPFEYLAKSDVQKSLSEVRVLIRKNHVDFDQYQTAINSFKKSIDDDIEEYTKELKYLVKEE